MAEGGGDNTVIDIEPLASSMENKLMGINQPFSPTTSCIFRTPSILAKQNPEAYSPNCFSFGPFHHDQEKFKVTEEIKLIYLQSLLSRSNNPERKLRECLRSIKEVKRMALDCYGGQSEPQDFVEMLVVDGCFILELFRRDANEVAHEDDDPIFSMSCMLQFLYHDLILLENQIPWFVLERLFVLTKSPSEIKSLIELALHFFGSMFSSHTLDDHLQSHQHFAGQNQIKHILDLLRLCLVLPSQEVRHYQRNKRQYFGAWTPIPSVTKLNEAGVKFVRVTKDSILDLKFENGDLQIPALLIQETTETIFRNLISYEQCLPNCGPIFTSYALVLSHLIDNTDDTLILSKNDIIDSWVSLDEATKFFDKLYYNTYVKEFYYWRLSYDLNSYCRRRWPRWRAAYVHNYLSKSWIVVVVAAQLYAFAMLVLTFLQTFFTVKR